MPASCFQLENKVHTCIPFLPIFPAFIDRQRIIVYDSDVQVTAANRYGMTHRFRGRRGHDWEGPYVFINNPVEHHHTHARTHGHKHAGGGYLPLSGNAESPPLQPFHLHKREMFARRHHIPKGADEFPPRALRHPLLCSGVGSRHDSRQRGFFMLHACWREINKEPLTPTATCFPSASTPHGSLWPFPKRPRPAPSSARVELEARRPAAWCRPHKGTPDSRPVTSDATSLTLNHLCFPADLQDFCIICFERTLHVGMRVFASSAAWAVVSCCLPQVASWMLG